MYEALSYYCLLQTSAPHIGTVLQVEGGGKSIGAVGVGSGRGQGGGGYLGGGEGGYSDVRAIKDPPPLNVTSPLR